jgi:hypothetical protein
LGVDETKPISGESRRRQQGEWDAGFCETKPISYLGVWVGAGSGAWRTMKKPWSAMRLKSSVFNNAPT